MKRNRFELNRSTELLAFIQEVFISVLDTIKLDFIGHFQSKLGKNKNIYVRIVIS